MWLGKYDSHEMRIDGVFSPTAEMIDEFLLMI